jgi:predicted Zn-dependent peptidase
MSRPLTAALSLALVGACAKAPSAVTAPQSSAAPSIPFEKYELNNGLDVILSEDHSVPFVWVEVWYQVGSKDEQAGLTGFAHLFEHLMFQGSAHMNDDYFVPLQKIGAEVNGTTNTDRTNYYEGVPSEQLPLALWLEADRMGWLLPALTPEKLQNQKDVVRNERRQRYENRPYGQVGVWRNEALFPEGHPYRVTTIGKHEDIENAKMEDVQAFFKKWYVPNGASLAIVGDFDPAEAKALVQKYFGDIPRGADPTPITSAPAALPASKVLHYESRVPHHQVSLAWLSPPLFAEGDATLDFVASMLTEGADSRLYQELVQKQQIAKDVVAYQGSARLASQFIIQATAAPGHSTDDLVAAIDAELAKLAAAPPPADELELIRTGWEVRFYGSLQTIAGKSGQLSSYNSLLGDPGALGRDLARYQAITPAEVQKVASTVLSGPRVALHVHPLGEAPAGSILDNTVQARP